MMETRTKYWSPKKNRNLITGYREDPEEDKRLCRERICLPNISFVSVRTGKRFTQ